MEISYKTLHGITIVQVSGKLDAITVPAFDKEIRAVTTQGALKILLDFSSLVYISSGGLRVILAIAKVQKNAGRAFALSGLSPEVNKVFTLSGLNTILSIFPSETNALAQMK